MINLITPQGHKYVLQIAQIGGQADKASQLGGNAVFLVSPTPEASDLNDFYKGIVAATNNGFNGVLVGDSSFVFQGYLLQFNQGELGHDTLLSVDYKTIMLIGKSE